METGGRLERVGRREIDLQRWRGKKEGGEETGGGVRVQEREGGKNRGETVKGCGRGEKPRGTGQKEIDRERDRARE